MKFTDAMALSSAMKRTADGYATMSARVARGGNVQVYLGAELGVMDRETIRVYRPDAEVFRIDAIKTYAGVPATMGHPRDGVNAANWKDLAVGEVGDEVLRDGEFVRVPMILRDASAIAAVEAGTRELSMGYTADIEFQDGVTPSGDAYDAVMSGFKMNHIAIVQTARGGIDLRIGDAAEQWGAAPLTKSNKKEDTMSDALKTVVLGDKAAQVAAADAPTIEQFKADTAKTLTDAATAHDKAMAIKDAQLAAKDAEIADLKAKVLTDAAIDARVAARADLVAKAKALVADVAVDGKSDAEIRKAVVLAKRGAAMADKSAAYIDAAFDYLTDTADVADPVRLALGDQKVTETLAAVYAARDTQLADAWKGSATQKGA